MLKKFVVGAIAAGVLAVPLAGVARATKSRQSFARLCGLTRGASLTNTLSTTRPEPGRWQPASLRRQEGEVVNTGHR